MIHTVGSLRYHSGNLDNVYLTTVIKHLNYLSYLNET